MLQLITRLPGRPIIQRRSFYYVLGIFSTKETNNSNRFNFLPASLSNEYSSNSIKRHLSSGKCDRDVESFSDKNAEVGGGSEGTLEKNSVLSSDSGSHINTILKEEVKETTDFPLKINNIELFREIANGDDDVYQKLLDLQTRLEVTACRFGVNVDIRKDKWVELLSCSFTKRKSFVASEIVNAVRDAKDQIQRTTIKYRFKRNCKTAIADNCEDEDEDDDDNIVNYDDIRCYHLFHNSMFLKLIPKTMKKVRYSRGIAAMLYSPMILFDCSYCKYMSNKEIRELCRQLVNAISINCYSQSPFHLALCNFQDPYMEQQMLHCNSKIYSKEYPVTITRKSFLDLFPKENLVYLTPHCNTNLKCLEPDKTYIVGAFVDKSCKKSISLAKAKEQNIAMAKFPIDKYLDWGLGNKSLALPHVMRILLDLKTYDNNWNKAFETIPQRCLMKERPKRLKPTLDDVIVKTFELTQPDFTSCKIF